MGERNNKYSIFNNTISLCDNETFMYNSLSGALIKLPESGLPEKPDDLPHDVFTVMKHSGYIVDSDTDEASYVYDRVIRNLSSDDNFYLIVNPTLQCNCRCWYCIETHPSGSMAQQMYRKMQELIIQILPRVKSLTISFFGGEPFLEYQSIVKPLMEWSRDICREKKKELFFVFTTNSLLLSDDRITFLKDFPNQSYQITLDGNRECHNKTRVLRNGDSYGKTVENIKKLARAGMPVIVRLNLTHDNFMTAYDIINDFEDLPKEYKKNLSLSCQQVWQDAAKGPLADEFMQINRRFLEIGIVAMPQKFDWLTDSCYGDRLNSVVVNYNGELFKCSAVDYCSDKPIGHLEEADIIETLNDDFKKYINGKMADPACRNCRVLPMCTRGCYKRIMIYKEGCIHPTEEEKNQLVIRALEEMAFSNLLNNSTETLRTN